ncbi:MAG TPA: 16S rRNA (cytosine(967)-C(5))-methyltransferase RsmB [Pyrinomonadaceae bacterium]
MAISPARIAAYEVLLRVERDRAFTSILLPQYQANMSEKDAALCQQLVLGVLRRKFYLDAVISQFSAKRKLDLEVVTAIRLGAYQILELDRIPDYSAVNESVQLVRRAKKASAKGFVNAILRRIAKRGPLPESGDSIETASIETSHPRWLLERWIQQFGRERALAIAEANNQPPRLAFRFTGHPEPEVPQEANPSQIVEGGYTVEKFTRELKELAEAGQIYFQDEASQLIARSVQIPDSGTFLDVCASPGGKTSLAAKANRGRSLTLAAGDVHQARVELLRSNCISQGFPEVLVARYDAVAALPFADGSFDAILVDAPCSGTGTIRSNPEIRYFLRPDDIEELSRKQLTILTNASNLLRKGGKLYYSTCSLEREENEGVIAKFLDEHNEFRHVEDGIYKRFRTDEGFGRTFPDRDGTDGFFFAILERD